MDFHGDHKPRAQATQVKPSARLDSICPWPSFSDSGTHGRHPTRRYRHREPTARRRGDQELPPGPGWQPEPGLRPQHHATSFQNERFGSSSHPQQNGRLTRPQDIDAPLHIAAQRKINGYRQQSEHFFSPCHSVHFNLHGEFLRLLFLQAHRETEAHFTATGSHCNATNRTRSGLSALYSSNR